jgi:SAM-dependent methyltransferase
LLLLVKIGLVSADGDDELIEEQIDFYRTDAAAFDDWLVTLVDGHNHEPVAQNYRAGRERVTELLAQRAPLGDVLEIAAGTGRLAELYVPLSDSVLLLDASPESLAIAGRRLDSEPRITFVEADIFDWKHDDTFDTIVFSAWLHHVPDSRFAAFWTKVQTLLARGGRVIFDFPDAEVSPPGKVDIPAEPTEDYGFYAPQGGISVRDHFGRRWRVIHNLWHRDELTSRLDDLGWNIEFVGPGLFENIVWAEATR